MKNILVTIDFDKSKELLLQKATEMATAFGAKLWLLHVADPLLDFDELKTGRQAIRDNKAEELREARKELQDYAASLTDKGIPSEALLIPGDTTESIIQESLDLKVDLIITGHNEHGFFYNAFVGSVSSEIIKKSKIPVLVVPLD